MKIRACQLNPIVGDVIANFRMVHQQIEMAKSAEIDLLIFSELFLSGYPARDYLLHLPFLKKIRDKLEKLKEIKDISILVGAPVLEKGRLYNALFFNNGKGLIDSTDFIYKKILPNYDVFDESRYFVSANDTADLVSLEKNIINIKGKKIFINICEDSWFASSKSYLNFPYREDFPWTKIKKITDILINVSASPFTQYKLSQRVALMKSLVRIVQKPLIYLNQWGANDDLVFDGNSFILDEKEKLAFEPIAFNDFYFDYIYQNNQWYCDFLSFSNKNKFNKIKKKWNEKNGKIIEAELFLALKCGLNDYLKKTKLTQVVIGLSGGIDSALIYAIAVETIGKENVFAYTLPSKYSSQESVQDSKALVENYRGQLKELPIHSGVNTIEEILSSDFYRTDPPGITEENIQARLRGLLLMAIANKKNALMLTTGNKSELATGYCTLYGDMNGGLSLIGDLYKTEIYNLCQFLNSRGNECIPKSIIDKPPSAELKLDQKDEDSLPPYNILDNILYTLIEKNMDVKSIYQFFQDSSELKEVEKKIYTVELIEDIKRKYFYSEYKRYQTPPVLKLSEKSFGNGRRFPLTAYPL